MSEHLIEIALDYDKTYRRTRADKEDGYAETSRGVTSISDPYTFPLSPPIRISMVDLEHMPTPPLYLGDARMGYVKFGNDWLPLGGFSEDIQDRESRSRAEAQAHTRIQRLKQIKAASEKHAQSMSDAFKYMVIAVSSVFVISSLIIAFMVSKWGG